MNKVIDAVPRDNFRIELTFNDGTVRLFDLTPYLKYPVFAPLDDPSMFRQLTVGYGTVQWPGGADISPETLYLESTKIGEVVIA